MIVVPMPDSDASACARSWMVRFAAPIERWQHFLGGAVRQTLLEGLDRGHRGDLAGLGSAHPVRDHEQRRAGQERVLVGLALATGIGSLGMLRDADQLSVHLESK